MKETYSTIFLQTRVPSSKSYNLIDFWRIWTPCNTTINHSAHLRYSFLLQRNLSVAFLSDRSSRLIYAPFHRSAAILKMLRPCGSFFGTRGSFPRPFLVCPPFAVSALEDLWPNGTTEDWETGWTIMRYVNCSAMAGVIVPWMMGNLAAEWSLCGFIESCIKRSESN